MSGQAETEIAQWAQANGYLPPQDNQSYVIYEDGTEAREWRLVERTPRRIGPALPTCQVLHTEEAARGRSRPRHGPSRPARQRREFFQTVFVGTLGVDHLVLIEGKRLPDDMDLLYPAD